ncbi:MULTISPECIES: hypothetical protein [unclassified Pseudomonas]|nr:MULTISPECIES: hypothetical protein [unclassified Pseudomonas]
MKKLLIGCMKIVLSVNRCGNFSQALVDSTRAKFKKPQSLQTIKQ